MSRRYRKLIGTVGMLLFIGAYAVLALKVAELQVLNDAHWVVQALCFAVLGIGWALPLMPLIWWMEQGMPEAPQRGKDPLKRR